MSLRHGHGLVDLVWYIALVNIALYCFKTESRVPGGMWYKPIIV